MNAKANEYPLALDQIVSWFRLKEQTLARFGVTLAEVRQRDEYLPAAAADFDSANAMGRISVWVSGFFDFEVLRIADAKSVFFGHAEVSSIESPEVERAYDDFVRYMSDPDELEPMLTLQPRCK